MSRSLLPKFACLAVALGITSVLFIQYCDLLFDCGCQAHWAAAADYCNVHNAEPPHCPWCAGDGASGRWSFRLIIASQTILALWPGRLGRTRRGPGACGAGPHSRSNGLLGVPRGRRGWGNRYGPGDGLLDVGLRGMRGIPLHRLALPATCPVGSQTVSGTTYGCRYRRVRNSLAIPLPTNEPLAGSICSCCWQR